MIVQQGYLPIQEQITCTSEQSQPTLLVTSDHYLIMPIVQTFICLS